MPSTSFSHYKPLPDEGTGVWSCWKVVFIRLGGGVCCDIAVPEDRTQGNLFLLLTDDSPVWIQTFYLTNCVCVASYLVFHASTKPNLLGWGEITERCHGVSPSMIKYRETRWRDQPAVGQRLDNKENQIFMRIRSEKREMWLSLLHGVICWIH